VYLLNLTIDPVFPGGNTPLGRKIHESSCVLESFLDDRRGGCS
jgi:hypothetical protein